MFVPSEIFARNISIGIDTHLTLQLSINNTFSSAKLLDIIFLLHKYHNWNQYKTLMNGFQTFYENRI